MPRFILLLLMFIGPIIATSFFSVWQRNEMIRIGYETETLQRQKQVLLRRQKELRVEVERLSALDRIEQIAVEQLGMRRSRPEQRIFMTAQAPEEELQKAFIHLELHKMAP